MCTPHGNMVWGCCMYVPPYMYIYMTCDMCSVGPIHMLRCAHDIRMRHAEIFAADFFVCVTNPDDDYTTTMIMMTYDDIV